MNQELTAVNKKKHSQLKNALFSCIFDLFIIATQIGIFVEHIYRTNHLDIHYHNPTNAGIRISLRLITAFALIFISIYRLRFINSTEKTDELADLHRYKAGYIAKYITLLVIIIAICTIRNFEPLLSEDYFNNISLAIIILLFGEFVQNVIFIILEKFQLD